jgi:hypothetical protein
MSLTSEAAENILLSLADEDNTDHLPNESQPSASTSVTPGTNTTFTYFPRLPTEIQSQVWNISCRLSAEDISIIITYHLMITHHDSTAHSLSIEESFQLAGKVPSTLHVCHNSRQEAFRVYKPITPVSPIATQGGQIYFNPEADKVTFTSYEQHLTRVPTSLMPRRPAVLERIVKEFANTSRVTYEVVNNENWYRRSGEWCMVLEPIL